MAKINLRRDPVIKMHWPEFKSLSALEAKYYNLNNKKICFTGTIPGFTRPQASMLLLTKYPDITFSTDVTNMVDFLIVGEDPGYTKIEKAKRLKTLILDYKLISWNIWKKYGKPY